MGLEINLNYALELNRHGKKVSAFYLGKKEGNHRFVYGEKKGFVNEVFISDECIEVRGNEVTTDFFRYEHINPWSRFRFGRPMTNIFIPCYLGSDGKTINEEGFKLEKILEDLVSLNKQIPTLDISN